MGRSASRTLERLSAVAIAVPQPFLSRSWAGKWWKVGFLGYSKAIFGASRLETSPSQVRTG
jgi:hypothetical protein